MVFALQAGWRKFVWVTFCALLVTAYTAVVIRSYVAHVHATDLRPDSLTRAIQLEPGNAEYWHRRGLNIMLAGDAGNAVSDFKTAIAINPHNPRPWFSLANAYLILGEDAACAAAIAEAVRLDPKTPWTNLEAANLYLATGATELASQRFREATRYDPDTVLPSLRALWHVTHDTEAILKTGLFPTRSSLLQFLRFLLDQHETDAAGVVWSHLLALKGPLPLPVAWLYFDALLESHNTAAIEQAWNALLQNDPQLRTRISPGNLVVNGRFEQDIVNGGLEWRYERQPHVLAVLDEQAHHQGARSLRVSFDGESVGNFGLQQFIVVHPNTTYQVSAFVKADNIISAHGPRIAVFDAYSRQPLLLTDDLLDSTDWRPIKRTFTTGADTALVRLTFLRQPSQGGISGTFWVDDISMKANE
jgi:Carbohydrate binding domain/Tetratricopeptide repeat